MSEYEEYVCRFYPDSWGEKSITLFGVPIVRCRDCKFKDEPWNCAAPYYVEQNGFCAWGERK